MLNLIVINVYHFLTLQLIDRMHKLGVTYSSRSKLNILDEMGKNADNTIIAALKTKAGKMVKITGDNCDFKVRTSQQTTESHHQDNHWFVSNLILPRICSEDICDIKPNVTTLSYADVIPSPDDTKILQNSYKILIGRLFAERFENFKWMSSIIPSHIPHPYSIQMSRKSSVFSLPIMFCNEAKYDDCMKIMDNYEREIADYYIKAGGISLSHCIFFKYIFMINP